MCESNYSVGNLSDFLQRPDHLKFKNIRSGHAILLDKNENIDPALIDLYSKIPFVVSEKLLPFYPDMAKHYDDLSTYLGIDASHLFISSGSDGVIRAVFDSLIEPGDRVIITCPTFAMYEVYSKICRANLIKIHYRNKGSLFELDTARLIDSIRVCKPKLVCLPNPDSPSGTVIHPDLIAEILAECERIGAILLIDEAYYPFYHVSSVHNVDDSPNIIVIRSFSKAWGLAGIRLGFGISQPMLTRQLHLRKAMYEAGSFQLSIMSSVLKFEPQILESVRRLVSARDLFCSELGRRGFQTINTKANFLHVYFNAYDQRIKAAMMGKVLYRTDFAHPSMDGLSRFSIGPLPIMQYVLDLIDSVID